MATQLKTVAATVHEVTTAFDKAVNLVRRIEDRKDTNDDPVAIQDLYKSLALGPTIVQGYFDADSKRLGQAYLTGDFEAQYQLQGVLLNLKTLVSALQTILLDDEPIDYDQLQQTSDECRVNAGVCLGQLSQRMSKAQESVRLYPTSPPAYASDSVYNDTGLSYSASRSTQSSGHATRTPLTPPLSELGRHNLSPQWHAKPDPQMALRQPYSPPLERQTTDQSLQESIMHWAGTGQLHTDTAANETSRRRPSSPTLGPVDTALLSSPRPANSALPGAQDLVRDSYQSYGTTVRTDTRASAVSSQYSHQSRERFGPEDFSPVSPQSQYGPLYLIQAEPEDGRQSVTSYATRMDHAPVAAHLIAHQPSIQHLPTRNGSLPVRNESTARRLHYAPLAASPIEGHADEFHRYAPGALPALTPQFNVYNQSGHVDLGQWPVPPRSTPRSVSSPQQDSPTSRHQVNDDRVRQLHMAYQLQPAAPPPTVPIPPTPTDQRPYTPSSTTSSRRQFQQQSLRQQSSHVPITALPQSSQQAYPPQTPIDIPRQPSIPNLPQAVSTATPPPARLPIVALTLPDERNPAPFCKMSLRSFHHPLHLKASTAKAFNSAQRPLGMNNMIPYWRCDKCLYEGPMAFAPGPPDKKGRPGKQEKIFDPTIRSSVDAGPTPGSGQVGIRYRWSFLAKSHVPLKTVPEGRRDGSYGSFACLFCTAEASGRNWNTNLDAMSVKSSSSNTVTPVFGNLQSFMDHLQRHRDREWWPGLEMQGRMKCVVGRVAGKDEDFDVNFLPLDGQ